MVIHNLELNNSLANKYIAELRDVNIQKDSMRFRRNIERIGEILSYEFSKTLSYVEKDVVTPLGTKKSLLPENDIVVCSILRAGLPIHNGILNYFDGAENAFISAYRYHPNNDAEFEIKVEYLASPSLEGKTLIIADPMLATGNSMVAVYETLLKHGNPKEVHVFAVIGANQGVELVADSLPENTHLWIATIDAELNDHGYIIPGLGDAGDLAFGSKL
ncbi:uracil phosphoribosyltransferase [Aureivirga sp. CE67]|uniref:uracil phosphoribosyltransferase n=1 Tax=Aureivirga sp. CE67 TaxID=1788983 RepID=UPI0018C95C50|nr:uracil phosphoribosyltransferase [Aureivirga sp. CE67]